MKKLMLIITGVTIFTSIFLFSFKIGRDSINNEPSIRVSVADIIKCEWQPHTVQQYQGDALVDIPATALVTTCKYVWGQRFIYMPDKNRLLLQTTVSLYSDDLGITWIETNIPAGFLTYLGGGEVLSRGEKEIWKSTDYGATWQYFATMPRVPVLEVAYGSMGPMLVDKDRGTGNVVLLVESGYGVVGDVAQGYVRFSTDGGFTWPKVIMTNPWTSETVLVRAGNGDIVAATRTSGTASIPDPDAPYDWARVGTQRDFYSGLGVYISKDNGNTWSPVNKLYEFGRHHPSVVLMPNNDLVMSYVVRLGYGDPLVGLPKYGIEAVVSHDNGQTWDLDYRYILDRWDGEWLDRPGGKVKLMAPNETYTVLLPDGSLITAYGKGFSEAQRIEHQCSAGNNHGVQLVHWRIND